MRTTTYCTILLSGLTLALSACSGGAGVDDLVPTAMAAEPATVAQPAHRTHDPAKFIERFDKDHDGALEVSEVPERMQKFFAKIDVNGDGKITADELKAQKERMGQEHFAKMDKNGDGALTADEVGDKRWSRLSVADADGNGSVTKAELDQARAAGKLHCDGKHRHASAHGEGFRRLDKDGDGAVTAAEAGEKRWARLVVADANGDGKVTLDELKAARDSGKLGPMHRPARNSNGG